MNATMKTVACTIIGATIMHIEAAPAWALPYIASPFAIAGGSQFHGYVEPVQYRGGRRYRVNSYRRGSGGNIALGISAAIIGGIVLSEAARAEHRSSHGGDWDRCTQAYRSFEPGTGLYTGYDGVRRTCPYLR